MLHNREEWIHWKFKEDLFDKRYYLQSIYDTNNFFEIILYAFPDERNKIKIIFKKGIETYQIIDETYRSETIYYLNKQYSTSFYNWPFFKIKNSSFIAATLGESAINKYMHFSIFTPHSIVDIASSYEPVIESFTI